MRLGAGRASRSSDGAGTAAPIPPKRRPRSPRRSSTPKCSRAGRSGAALRWDRDRKSTRLNSSHLGISYAVFCLKKKKKKRDDTQRTKKKQKKNKIELLIKKVQMST